MKQYQVKHLNTTMTVYQRQFWILAICLMMAVKATTPAKHQTRAKRQMTYASPIYYDTSPTAQPQFPQSQPQQGLPIIGTLIPGLNGITSLIPLGQLAQLGQLGQLGNLGQIINLGGLLPGIGLPQQQQQQCPLGQISRCRCENLISLTPKEQSTLEILQQNVKLNMNGQNEISARLSNGLLLYQRSGKEILPPTNQASNVIQGYYTMKVKDNKYLTIYYTISDVDYTVKADVTAEPPKNDLDELPPTLSGF